MNQVVVFYNPFLPELKITINGRKLSSYSYLKSFEHQRLDRWSDCLFRELYREVNSDYEMICVSNEFTCNLLKELAAQSQHCITFHAQPLPLNTTVYERLNKLEMLGCDEVQERIVVPIVNVSNDNDMTSAVYEVIDAQGIFEDVSLDSITWSDCPLVTLEINSFEAELIPFDTPVVIALCASDEDSINIDADVPIYALVMGTKTKFIKHQGRKLFFSVDPNDIGNLLLKIIEEEVLCPIVSKLSYEFSAQMTDFLTESEKEDLELVCQASPVCHTNIPQVCDVGRAVKLNTEILPSNSTAEIRIISDSRAVIDVDNDVLLPLSVGDAEVSVFIGDDPYPVASELIKVRKRDLITDISLFPSILFLPVGGESKISLTVSPDSAENVDEIRWISDNSCIASVDPYTGVIRANTCGRCSITAYTAEISKSVSLEVQPYIEDIVCPCSFLELTVGEQKKWQIQVVPPNAYGFDSLRILSSDKNVAEYRGGYIIGRSVGNCTIYIKNQIGSLSRELKVSVKKNKRLW